LGEEVTSTLLLLCSVYCTVLDSTLQYSSTLQETPAAIPLETSSRRPILSLFHRDICQGRKEPWWTFSLLGAGTQVPGFEAEPANPALQVHVGVFVGPLRLQEPWPLHGPLRLSAPQNRAHRALLRCRGASPKGISTQSCRQLFPKAAVSRTTERLQVMGSYRAPEGGNPRAEAEAR